MKRLVILFFALVFLLGCALDANAGEVVLSGDARVRGVWQRNYDFDESTDVDERWYDQRFRLNVTGDVRDVEARARITVLEGKFSEKMSDVSADYAYLHIPVGPITLDIGRQDFNWGNGYEVWDDMADRLKISSKVKDIKLGIFADKAVETNVAGDYNLKDKDEYGGLIDGKFGAIHAGVLVIQGVDSRRQLKDMTAPDYQCAGELAAYNTADAAYDAALADYIAAPNVITENTLAEANDAAVDAKDAHDDCRDEYAKASGGTAADVYVKGMIGPIDLSMEFAMKIGGLNEVDEDKSPIGLVVSGSIPMDAVTYNMDLVYASNGYKADDEFMPTLFFGTEQATAAMDFGECATPDLSKYAADTARGDIDSDGMTDPCSSLAGVLGVEYRATYAVSIGAKVAYVKWFDYTTNNESGTEFKSKDIDGWTKSAIEIDAGFKYDIMKNVSYNLDIGCLIPSMNDSDNVAGSPESDIALAIAHGISVRF